MFIVEWGYKGCSNVHRQEFADENMADTLTAELKQSTIVVWQSVTLPNGETIWP